MAKKHTILQILPTLDTGGVERGTVDIARALVDAGHHAIVVSNGGALVQHLDVMGATHITLPVHSKNPVTLWQNRTMLMNIIREHRVDLVHARSRAPAWSAYYACRGCDIPYITTFHGTYNFNSRLKKQYNSIMVRGRTTIVASDFIRRHVIENYGPYSPPITLIPRGVDMAIFDKTTIQANSVSDLLREWGVEKADTDNTRKIILLPGRLTRWKGQELLLDALAMLKQDYTPKTMPICVLLGSDQGRTQYSQHLRNRAKTLGLDIRMPGNTQDMATAYYVSDVVVSASTDPEAFGRVSAEAQAMGCPIIAPNHGAAPEIVVAGETGWLFEPCNVHSLAKSLKLALSLNPNQRQTLATKGINHIKQNLTNAHMCQRTLAVYDRILES